MLYQYSRCLGNWYSDIGGTTGGPDTDAVHHPTLIFPLLLTYNIHHRGEREFPFPVIPGNTSLKFPVPSLPVAF